MKLCGFPLCWIDTQTINRNNDNRLIVYTPFGYMPNCGISLITRLKKIYFRKQLIIQKPLGFRNNRKNCDFITKINRKNLDELISYINTLCSQILHQIRIIYKKNFLELFSVLSKTKSIVTRVAIIRVTSLKLKFDYFITSSNFSQKIKSEFFFRDKLLSPSFQHNHYNTLLKSSYHQKSYIAVKMVNLLRDFVQEFYN